MAYLEIQIGTVVHHFIVPTSDDGLKIIAALEPHIGKEIFMRNREEPSSMRFRTVDGESVITLSGIMAARLTDYDVFDDADAKRRKARYAEMREIDLEMMAKVARSTDVKVD